MSRAPKSHAWNSEAAREAWHQLERLHSAGLELDGVSVAVGAGLPNTARIPVGAVRRITHWIFRRDCPRCGEPLEQELVERRERGGEHWVGLPCACAQIGDTT